MPSVTALDLSARRYAAPLAQSLRGWGQREAGLKYAYPRPLRSHPDGQRLLLQLADCPRPKLDLSRHTARMLRRAKRLAYKNRRAVVHGVETCAFGTFLATFLSCVWILGA